jgi:hypothetical protein
MNGFKHHESPHLALMKSAATMVLSDQAGTTAGGACVDLNHPIIQALDHYSAYLERGESVPHPDTDSAEENDPEVGAYLAFLHHRKTHARINQNQELEADLDRQLARFKYGNPLWQQMFVEYFEYYWQYPFHKAESPLYRSWKDPAYGKGDPSYGVVKWRLPSDATIAVIGDIGTGTDVAAAVLLGAMSFKPDAFFHLGDVYFSGTQFEIEHRYVGLFNEVFEDQGIRVPVFGVPGNHEYFTGAVNYLKMLDSGALAVVPEQKQSASYFSVRTEDNGWQFLGIDTGFHGHYMDVPENIQKAILEYIHDGELGIAPEGHPEWPQGINPHFNKADGANLPVKDSSRPPDMVHARHDEAEWHRHQIENFLGRTVLLSHHQLYSANQTCGVAQRLVNGKPDPSDLNRIGVNTRLWKQFGRHFGDSVAAWIWGHEHNLAIYQSDYRPDGWPTPRTSEDEDLKTLPKGRCAGHAAIPVGPDPDPYQQNNPIPLEQPDLKLDMTDGWYNRGFEIIQLKGAGKPANIRYFQVNGVDPTPLEIFSEDIK